MNFSELPGGETHAIYQQVATENNARHYGFLSSMIQAAVSSGKTWLSESLIKALNFHAIVGLHDQAGQYRCHSVKVGNHLPPEHYRVAPLMEDFINVVNRSWERSAAPVLASWTLWRLNYIHPFVNGNGRTARAVCYYILCVKSGGLLPGTPILPEILRQEPARSQYVLALHRADNGDFQPLFQLVQGLIAQQIA